ncbi:MAG: division/cell wall cluster transcriptional repressor MraZ [Planctomycetota bacterium]|nr:division/cell wall cluster transcriptional repressor MraZ [Planctomycetota bacterium]
MALTGTWPRTLDDKGRLAVPKRVREDLGGMDLKSLFLAPWTEKSLAVFTPKNFETLAQRFSEKSAGKSDVRNYMRLFYAKAEQLDVDSQGRIRIPDRLKAFAELDREVVLLGVNDHLEVWDAARWDAYVGQLNPQFDEIAEHAYE